MTERATRCIREPSEEERRRWRAEFDAAARRRLSLRLRNAFIRTCRPVLDDAPFRAFDTMAHDRRGCNEALPSWLGFGNAGDAEEPRE